MDLFPEVASCRAYEPRQARKSPLYRVIIDELERWVVGLRGAPGPGPEACAEDSLRAFLGCGVLKFHPSAPPSPAELASLSHTLRRKILLRLRQLKAVPEEALEELLARPLGGFSLDGSVRIEAEDRAGLLRLLGYITRPAISIKRLSYKLGIVRYWPKKGHDGISDVIEVKPADFLAKFARLIPPARIHLVRYHGALGPRSPLRPAVTQAARERANFQLILDGMAVTGALGAAAAALRAARKAVSRVSRRWAACLGRIFQVDVIKCWQCGGAMKLIAVIGEDLELDRLLPHIGVEADFPITMPARSPPMIRGDADTQFDPRAEAWEGIDEERAET